MPPVVRTRGLEQVSRVQHRTVRQPPMDVDHGRRRRLLLRVEQRLHVGRRGRCDRVPFRDRDDVLPGMGDRQRGIGSEWPTALRAQ